MDPLKGILVHSHDTEPPPQYQPILEEFGVTYTNFFFPCFVPSLSFSVSLSHTFGLPLLCSHLVSFFPSPEMLMMLMSAAVLSSLIHSSLVFLSPYQWLSMLLILRLPKSMICSNSNVVISLSIIGHLLVFLSLFTFCFMVNVSLSLSPLHAGTQLLDHDKSEPPF